MRISLTGAYLLAGVLASASAVYGQGMTLGEFEYTNSCVACHGASGKGDGPVTDFLSGAVVPDLTILQKNNGGVFPVQSVFDMIDGSDVASAHGTRDMPIWGERYRDRAALIGDEDADFPFDPARDSESYVRTRVLALIEYLSGIQEK